MRRAACQAGSQPAAPLHPSRLLKQRQQKLKGQGPHGHGTDRLALPFLPSRLPARPGRLCCGSGGAAAPATYPLCPRPCDLKPRFVYHTVCCWLICLNCAFLATPVVYLECRHTCPCPTRHGCLLWQPSILQVHHQIACKLCQYCVLQTKQGNLPLVSARATRGQGMRWNSGTCRLALAAAGASRRHGQVGFMLAHQAVAASPPCCSSLTRVSSKQQSPEARRPANPPLVSGGERAGGPAGACKALKCASEAEPCA